MKKLILFLNYIDQFLLEDNLLTKQDLDDIETAYEFQTSDLS